MSRQLASTRRPSRRGPAGVRTRAGRIIGARPPRGGRGGRVHLLRRATDPGRPAPRHRELGGLPPAAAARAPRGPRDRSRPARGGAERPDRPSRGSLPRDRGRLAGRPARHPGAGRHHTGRPFGGRGVGVVVRAGPPGPGQAARADRPARAPEDQLPAADAPGRHARGGSAAVAAGPTHPEVGDELGEGHGRAGDPGPSPGPDRPVGGPGPGPGHRPRRQGGDPPAGSRPSPCCRVPGSGGVPACDPRSWASWPCRP